MALRLLPAGEGDVPELVDVYFTTFQSPIVLALLPDVPSVREWYAKALSDDFQHSWAHVYKIVTTEDEKIIAFGKWTSPHEEAPGEGSAQYPAAGDPEMFEQVVKTASEKKEKLLGDEKSWYIGVIATLPQHQRKGAASLLMAQMCRQADEAGQVAYVESSPLGMTLYQRFGFETKDTFTTMIKGEPYVDCCMVRQPQKQ